MTRMVDHSLFLTIIGGIIFSLACGVLGEFKSEPNALSPPLNPDFGLDTPLMITRNGYEVECHTVITVDGYVLVLHRIPRKNGKPVLCQHGLFGTSADFLVAGREISLAYFLADNGYDVWLGNFRGNTYSRAHKVYPTTIPKFWDFGWHEMGIYDLPAVISYIVKETGQKPFYIGHSMGTTAFFVMCSERPEMRENVTAMFALAPEAFVGRMKSPIRYLTPFTGLIKWLLEFFGIYEFLPQSIFVKSFARRVCNMRPIGREVCANGLFFIVGFDSPQLNRTQLPVIVSHIPGGASTKTLAHYGQEIQSGEFWQYDYGQIKNKAVYGSAQPPKYDISKITVPTHLFYGVNDYLANVKDVEKFARMLPNLKANFKVRWDKWNHYDFIFANDAKNLVYEPLLGMIRQYA